MPTPPMIAPVITSRDRAEGRACANPSSTWCGLKSPIVARADDEVAIATVSERRNDPPIPTPMPAALVHRQQSVGLKPDPGAGEARPVVDVVGLKPADQSGPTDRAVKACPGSGRGRPSPMWSAAVHGRDFSPTPFHSCGEDVGRNPSAATPARGGARKDGAIAPTRPIGVYSARAAHAQLDAPAAAGRERRQAEEPHTRKARDVRVHERQELALAGHRTRDRALDRRLAHERGIAGREHPVHHRPGHLGKPGRNDGRAPRTPEPERVGDDPRPPGNRPSARGADRRRRRSGPRSRPTPGCRSSGTPSAAAAACRVRSSGVAPMPPNENTTMSPRSERLAQQRREPPAIVADEGRPVDGELAARGERRSRAARWRSGALRPRGISSPTTTTPIDRGNAAPALIVRARSRAADPACPSR